MSEKACRKCHLLVSKGQVCPECKTASLSEDWSGIVIVLDPKGSKIAETLGISKPGRYALKVR